MHIQIVQAYEQCIVLLLMYQAYFEGTGLFAHGTFTSDSLNLRT